jgi:chromosomal replication initiation ATPase DnaA
MNTDQKLKADRWRLKLALLLVAYALNLPVARLEGRSRDPTIVFARRAAMYLACVALNLSAKRVARAFGRDPTTVTDACRHVEDMRAEPRFDRWIEALERTVQAAPAPFKVRAE